MTIMTSKMTNSLNFFFVVLATGLLLGLTSSETKDGSTGYISCSYGSTSCTILCDSDNKCGSNSNTYESEGELHCPSGPSCQECTLICEGDYACKQASIYGESCAQLNVILKSGHTVGRYLTVYAPSDGSLYVNVTTLVTNDPFRDGIINAASTTDEIIVDCNKGAGTNDECKNMELNGEDANYVEVNCQNSADCETPKIHCPTASSLDPQVKKPCNVNCDSVTTCTPEIYVASNAWGTDLEIPNYQCSSTCDAIVFCGGSTSNYCTMDSSTTCDGSTGGSGCPNPTAYPTPLPTDEPSNEPTDKPTDRPTNNPTDKPTPIPTLRPTDLPTNNPTDKPTGQPTADPFVVPTSVPTDRPTDEPTSDPTDKPTNAPSSDPTDRPTDHPTNDPTDKPTNEPTNDPTDHPTNDPTNKPSAQPSDDPTPVPTDKPTDDPTPVPTDRPTAPPTGDPTGAPTTPNPTRVPSNIPSDVPTLTFPPTFVPTNPTASPSETPVKSPTSQPVNYTTAEPSLAPSNPPTEDSEGFGAGTTQTGTSDSTGLIIGIVISVAAVMAAGIGFFMYMRKQKETDKKNALALQKAIKDKGELTTGKRGELHNTDSFAPIQSTSHVLMVTPHGGTTPGGPDIVVPQTPTSPQEGFHVAMPDFTGSNRNAATRQSTVAVTPGNDGNRNSNINMTNSYKAKTGNVFLSTNDDDEDDDGEFNDEEKEIEFVTPGGPAMGFDVTENDDENEDNNSDTSQSSQEELDAIRSQIVAQSIASGVTPGGPGGGASGPNGFNPNAWNPTTDPNGETQKQQRQKYEQARRDSAEMGIEIAKLMDEVDNQKKEAKAKINAKDDKFGAMLNDNLMATDLIETDIVNEMNDDLMNPNKANETPAGDNGGLDENGYGLTPGGDDNDNSISNNGGEGGESYQ